MSSVVSASASSVALLLNSASAVASAPAPAPAPAPGVSLPGDTAASLTTDAGVVATLSAGAASADSTTQLYDNLAALSVAADRPAPAPTAEGPPTVDVNAEWAQVLQSNPSLAPVAAQQSLDAGIVDTLA